MKKVVLILVLVIVAIVLGLGALMFLGSRPITKSQAISAIEDIVESAVGKKYITQSIVYINSGKYGVDEHITFGKINGTPIDGYQPFHIASAGKAFTATLIGVLMDQEEISLDDKISAFLDAKTLDELFVYKNADYSDLVTVGQLLNHTSGVADYFDDKANGSKSLTELVVANPDKFWTPNDLLDFSRKYQTPVGIPGEKYHYSDTGYILLGLIIEDVSDMQFHEFLQQEIFDPLNMADSYLMFYSHPANEKRPLADIWLDGVNIKDYQSLSIDWAGGGIISTTDDLAKFIRSLNNYEIVSQSTLESLYQFDDYKFMNGIHYGYGFMEYHFNEFMPTLSSMPNYIGHMGILGTQMFYDRSTDTVYISSYGSADAPSVSVQNMIKIISTLQRIE